MRRNEFLFCLLVAFIFFTGCEASQSTEPDSTIPATENAETLRLRLEAADAELAKRESELREAQATIAWQQELIREHSLEHPAQSIDSMLALFPAPFPQGEWAWSELDAEDCWFQSADGMRLHGWLLSHAKPKAIVLMAHGNAGNVTHRLAYAKHLWEEHSCAVFIFDYRGYGRSEGTPTIEGLVLDAKAARDFLAARLDVERDQIVLHGSSMGGGVVVEVAKELTPRALILESTFTSLRDVASNHYPSFLVGALVADRLDSEKSLASIHCPVLISHGTADETIPFSQGERLFAAASEPKQWFAVEGANHNNAVTPEYLETLAEFLERLPSS